MSQREAGLMVDWQMLEGIGGVATAAALIVALVFGTLQVRQSTIARRDSDATAIVTHLLTPQFVAALDRVLQHDIELSPEAIRTDPALRRDVMLVDFTFETAGIMVHDRRLPLELADRLIGGVIRTAWRRVRPYVEEERERRGSATFGEWWQWLVERMGDEPSTAKREGAHVAYRAWRP